MNTSTASIPEKNMIPIIRTEFLSKVLGKKQNDDRYSVGEEFRSQYGIPDLLFYNFDNQVIDKRIDKRIRPVLSKEVIKTLLLIQDKKKISMSFLQENLPFNKIVIKNKVLGYLIQNNYLNKSIKDSELFWVGENTYESCMNNMFAVEAKISNWKRGFYQAYRYKWFANYSFLALHENFLNPAVNQLSLFRQFNIGLMSVSTNSDGVRVINKPRREKPYSIEIAALTFEKLFADYCEKNATSQSAQSSRLII